MQDRHLLLVLLVVVVVAVVVLAVAGPVSAGPLGPLLAAWDAAQHQVLHLGLVLLVLPACLC